MHPEMATALTQERQRELARQASRRHAHSATEYSDDITENPAHSRRIPHYRVSWSRMSLPAIGTAGRRERSWVIVISATKGL